MGLFGGRKNETPQAAKEAESAQMAPGQLAPGQKEDLNNLERPLSPWKNPVVIISTKSGGGHISAAKAVERAFGERGELTCAHVESLEHSSALYRGIYDHGFLKLVEMAPWAYEASFRITDRPQIKVPRHLAIAHKLNTRALRRSLKEHDPKVVFCTHFLPEQVALDLRKQEKITSKIAVVVTDYVVHAQWFGNVDLFFVGNELNKKNLMAKGIDGEKIKITGIPIDLKFSKQYDKQEAREKLSLRKDGEVVLFTGGGHGIGGVENTVKELFPALPSSSQLVVLCGKGEKLLQALNTFKVSLPEADRARLVPVGFTKEMEWYMAAADVMVGKPGGLTTSETLAMGLPFIMVNAMPGQEEGNADYVASAGAGIWVRDLQFLPSAISTLLTSPEQRELMSSAAKKIAKPNAAEDIRVELTKLASC